MNGLRPKLIYATNGKLRIWREPTKTEEFVIGADTSEGRVRDRGAGKSKLGASIMTDRPDRSAAVVLEKETGEHVATWHGWIDPVEFAVCLGALGLYYNTALLVPEINSMGVAVVSKLVDDIQYPRIYRSRVIAQVSADPLTNTFGWRTTQANRPLLIARIHEQLNTEQLWTHDPVLIDELRTMEYDEIGVPRARGKNKDDLVMALGMALQGRYELLHGQLDEAAEEHPDVDPETKRIWSLVQQNLHGTDRSRPGRSPSLPRCRVSGLGVRRT